MKAEQRKELETNTLADRMGQVVQKVKGGTRKTVITYVIVAVAVVVLSWFGYRYYIDSRQEASWRWAKFYDGAGGDISTLANNEFGEVSKSAKFQLAWFTYWDRGVRRLGREPVAAVAAISEAQKFYEKLAEAYKEDPIFHPQALLGQAAAMEALAVQDNKNLDKAKKLYEELITVNEGKYKESAEGKFAAERLKQLKDNDGTELRRHYQKLRDLLHVPLDDDFHKDLKMPPLPVPKK